MDGVFPEIRLLKSLKSICIESWTFSICPALFVSEFSVKITRLVPTASLALLYKIPLNPNLFTAYPNN